MINKMKKLLEITEGEWKVFDIYNKSQFHTWYKITNSETEEPAFGESICNITTRNSERSEANAKLIADAGTTANKCGKLPSELLKERDDLLLGIKRLYRISNNLSDVASECGVIDGQIMNEINSVYELIQSIEKE